MKIAICGSGTAFDQEVTNKAGLIGKDLASKGILVLTGACHGYPNEVAKAAFQAGGQVLGISPAKDQQEHEDLFRFPTKNFTQIEYTGLGIPARNFPLVKEADAIIIIGGQIGTLNEFTIAFHREKVIGVLEGSGGITELLDAIATACQKYSEKDNILYADHPTELVSLVLERLGSQ